MNHPRVTPVFSIPLKAISLFALFIGLLITPSDYTHAFAADGPSIFDQGRTHGSILVGSGSSSGGEFYLIVGGGLGHYIYDGLDLRLDADTTLGADPSVARLSPGVQYVLYFVPGIQPYVGTFYRHWFIGSGNDDLDSVGARIGGIFVRGAHTYIQVGAVMEKIVSDCGGEECSQVRPEIMMSLSF